GREKIKNVCLVIDHDDMVNGEETLLLNGAEVGTVNSPCYSHRLAKSLALAHVAPSASGVGTTLQVKGDGIDTSASVVNMPIYDPQKANTHA
ncbi:MAG: glycine cleavage T C-terminal barrel domain-containing protein, partial [Pseudomonadota bacterium]